MEGSLKSLLKSLPIGRIAMKVLSAGSFFLKQLEHSVSVTLGYPLLSGLGVVLWTWEGMEKGIRALRALRNLNLGIAVERY